MHADELNSDHFRFSLAGIIQARCREFCVSEPQTPDEVVQELIGTVAIRPEIADSLAWGSGPATMPLTQANELAELLYLDGDLLAAMLTENPELLAETLQRGAERWRAVLAGCCENCAAMIPLLRDAQATNGLAALRDLALQVLRHIHSEPPLFEGEEFLTEPSVTPEVPASLAAAISELDESERRRVLAFAYHERSARLVETHTPISSHELLRDSLLPGTAREALDLLAAAPGGALPECELVRQLGLAPEQLEAVRVQIRAATREAREHGCVYERGLLRVRARAGIRYYSLAPRARRLWRSLQAAELPFSDAHLV